MKKNSLSVLTLPKELYGFSGHFLRRKCSKFDINATSAVEMKTIVHNLVYFCLTDCGVSIAAPQIGLDARIIYVGNLSGKLKNTVLINPEIISSSQEVEVGPESCLSIPNQRGNVRRNSSIVVSYYDLDGCEKSVTMNGFGARVIQHEIDHLNGILYIDKVEGELEEIEDLFWVSAENSIKNMRGSAMGS